MQKLETGKKFIKGAIQARTIDALLEKRRQYREMTDKIHSSFDSEEVVELKKIIHFPHNDQASYDKAHYFLNRAYDIAVEKLFAIFDANGANLNENYLRDEIKLLRKAGSGYNTDDVAFGHQMAIDALESALSAVIEIQTPNGTHRR